MSFMVEFALLALKVYKTSSAVRWNIPTRLYD
jgi:hypothetical protein